MSTMVPLGPRGPLKGAADTTGRNPGKWTVTFDPATLNCYVPYFEVCHMVITGAKNSTFTIFVDLHQWGAAQNGQINEWDPSVAVPLFPGQYLYFFWSDPISDNTPPTVEIWLRWDQDIIPNQKAMYGNQPI